MLRALNRVAVIAAVAAGTALSGGGYAHADAEKDLYKDFSDAQGVTRGKGVTIALLGSGVDTGVKTLAGSVITGPDFVKMGKPKRIGSTLVASLITGGGPTHDAPFGVRGLAPGAKILSIRARPEPEDAGEAEFDRWFETHDPSDLDAKAIRHAADHGAQVIYVPSNRSDDSEEIKAAVAHAISKNAVVVATAYSHDKEYSDNVDEIGWPPGLPGVIGVGSVDADGERMPKHSIKNSSVFVSGLATKQDVTGPGNSPWQMWGDVASGAFVASAVALVRSAYPKLSPALVAQAIANSARRKPKSGYDTEVGNGIVNPNGAIKEARRLSEVLSAAAPGNGVASDKSHYGGGKAAPVKAVNHDVRLIAAFSGAIGGGVLFLAASLALLLWRRRKSRAPATVPTGEPPPGTPPPTVEATPVNPSDPDHSGIPPAL